MKHSLLDPAALQKIVYDTLDDSDDLVLLLEQTDESASGIIVATANDAFCRVSGYAHSDIAGRSLHALVAPNSDPTGYANVLQAARDLKPFRSEILCNRPNGTSFWLGMHLMPVRKSTPSTLRCPGP
jgi:PAS domain S-box-containing protein